MTTEEFEKYISAVQKEAEYVLNKNKKVEPVLIYGKIGNMIVDLVSVKELANPDLFSSYIWSLRQMHGLVFFVFETIDLRKIATDFEKNIDVKNLNTWPLIIFMIAYHQNESRRYVVEVKDNKISSPWERLEGEADYRLGEMPQYMKN